MRKKRREEKRNLKKSKEKKEELGGLFNEFMVNEEMNMNFSKIAIDLNLRHCASIYTLVHSFILAEEPLWHASERAGAQPQQDNQPQID